MYDVSGLWTWLRTFSRHRRSYSQNFIKCVITIATIHEHQIRLFFFVSEIVEKTSQHYDICNVLMPGFLFTWATVRTVITVISTVNLFLLPTDDLGNLVFSACKHQWNQLLSGSLWALPSCRSPMRLHLQLRRSEAHFPVFLTAAVCFDSRPVYRFMSWGLTGLRSPSNELRSEGNIQHSCAYFEGWGQERPGETCCCAFRYGTGLASEAFFREPVCIYKMFAWIQK